MEDVAQLGWHGGAGQVGLVHSDNDFDHSGEAFECGSGEGLGRRGGVATLRPVGTDPISDLGHVGSVGMQSGAAHQLTAGLFDEEVSVALVAVERPNPGFDNWRSASIDGMGSAHGSQRANSGWLASMATISAGRWNGRHRCNSTGGAASASGMPAMAKFGVWSGCCPTNEFLTSHPEGPPGRARWSGGRRRPRMDWHPGNSTPP